MQRAPRARHHRRWRLRHPRAGAASALSHRCRGYCAANRRSLDVLRPHGLRGHQEGAEFPARGPPANRGSRRRGHDGASIRACPNGQAELRR